MDVADVFAAGYSLESHVNELLIPYFYAQTYFSRYGKWPWGELSHGFVGLLQWLGREPDPTSQDIQDVYYWILTNYQSDVAKVTGVITEHPRCALCGLPIRTRLHHPSAWKGIMLIQGWLRRAKA